MDQGQCLFLLRGFPGRCHIQQGKATQLMMFWVHGGRKTKWALPLEADRLTHGASSHLLLGGNTSSQERKLGGGWLSMTPSDPEFWKRVLAGRGRDGHTHERAET